MHAVEETNPFPGAPRAMKEMCSRDAAFTNLALDEKAR